MTDKKHGEFLPNAKIDRIMIEGDGPSRMKVGVDLSISYKYEANLVGNWFKNEDFRKYVKIKIVQSTDKELTRRLNVRNNVSRNILMGGGLSTPIPSGHLHDAITIETLTIDDIMGSGEPTDIYSYQNSDGDIINKLIFHKKFSLQKSDPSHLAYFTFTHLDVDQMNIDHNIELTAASYAGSIFAELAIKGGRIYGKSHIFHTPDGKIWPGAVHQMPNGQWMTGSNPNHEPGLDKPWYERSSWPLTIKQVPNNKVHDFRQFEKIARLEIDLSTFEKDILPAQNKFAFLKNDNMNPSRKPVYFSDIYLTTDQLNRPSFGFSVDYDKMVKDTSVFGRLYETRMSPEKNIKSLSIKRRRIRDLINNNKLGSPVDSGTLFEDSIHETILITDDDPDGLVGKSDDTSGISELHLSAKNSSGIRFFNAYDKTVTLLSDGLYQYGVEIVLEDQTVNFLKLQSETLLVERNKLYKYYLECTKIGMSRSIVRIDDPHIDHFWEKELVKASTPGNYDPISNRFTQEFINKYITHLIGGINESNAPWASPIYSYFNALSIVTDFDNLSNKKSVTKNILAMVSPNSGNPQGVLAVLGLLDDLISKLGQLISDDNMGGSAADRSHTSNSKLPVKTTTINHWFTNEHFDSNSPKIFGYDYLSTSIPSPSKSGLRIISGSKYIERLQKEHSKYGLTMSAQSPTDFLSGDSSWSFLTPSYCFFGSSATDEVFDFRSTRDYGKYSMLESSILRFNTTDIPVQKGVYQHVEASTSELANSSLSGFDKSLKETLSDFYSEVNLTIEPASNSPRDDLNPNELYLSLMKTFSKTGLANHDSVENHYEEYGKTILFNKVHLRSRREINTKELTLGFYQSTIAELLSSAPESVPLGGAILASSGVPPNHPALNNVGYKILGPERMLRAVRTRLPMQVRFLMDSGTSFESDPLVDPKASSYFHFNHSMINRIDVLTGFSTDTPDSRLSNPMWEPLTKSRWESSQNGRVLICRMRPFNCAHIGIEQPKGLNLTVYDNYFMLVPAIPKDKKQASVAKYESLEKWLKWVRR